MERMVARCFREAGARVRTNVYVRDLNVPDVDLDDNRHIEVIAEGLPLYHGRQLAVDAALVSPLTIGGNPRLRNDDDGAVLKDTATKKRNHYADVNASRRCHLLVAGMETGGRWSEEFYKAI